MAWSPQFPVNSAKWGCVYFAIGTKSGHIRLMEVKDGKPRLLHEILLSNHWVTKLEWGSNVVTSTGERMSRQLILDSANYPRCIDLVCWFR